MKLNELIEMLKDDVLVISGKENPEITFSFTVNGEERVGAEYDGVSIMSNGTVVIEVEEDDSLTEPEDEEEEDEENDQD